MEFPFNCCQALGCDSEGFSVISSDKIRRNPSFSQISLIVDKMGEASSKVIENLCDFLLTRNFSYL
jgi:hypothetical protein